MKKEIHPDYHFINVKLTNGDVIQMRSTYGAEGDSLSLDIDPSVSSRLDGRWRTFDGHRRARVEVQKEIRRLGVLMCSVLLSIVHRPEKWVPLFG